MSILSSDVVLLLCDPVFTPISTLASMERHLINRPNTILVLTSVAPSEHRHTRIWMELSDLGCKPGRLLFVDPVQALDAITLLQTDPNFPLAIERYQRNSLDSQIAKIAVEISQLLGTREAADQSWLSLQTRTALAQMKVALDAGTNSVQFSAKAVDQLSTSVVQLQSQVEAAGREAESLVFGRTAEGDIVGLALAQGTNRIKATLDSLSFWNMVWRVDEVESLIGATVRKEWCRGLEDGVRRT